MKLLTNEKTYDAITFRPTADGCTITAQEDIVPGDTLVIQADDGTELRRYTVADWLRCEVDGSTLTLSASPAPDPPPEPDPPTPTEDEILAPQMLAAARALIAPCTALTDDQVLAMPDLFPAWETVLAEGKELAAERVISKDGQLYRVVQAVTPQEHQPPDGEGMLAIYRPINPEHAGTADDPIPFTYGMDALEGLYYSYQGALYQVAEGGSMQPCVWLPDSGVWQWILIGKE